jgi:hypothetical protein
MNELKTIWNKAVAVYSRHYFGISPEGVKNTMKTSARLCGVGISLEGGGKTSVRLGGVNISLYGVTKHHEKLHPGYVVSALAPRE